MTEAEFNGMTDEEYRRRRQAEHAKEHRRDANSYKTWKTDVDLLCAYHLYCRWLDLCGDEEPLTAAYQRHQTPLEFCQYWRDKYDLDWRD